jgi:hypothetical protein
MKRQSRFRRKLIAIRDNLSFSRKVEALVNMLNQEIDSPERVPTVAPSNPSGFVREVSKRRLNMAQAYLTLVGIQGVENWERRLQALQLVTWSAWNAKTLSMPVNTARVQIQLMKECIQARGRRRRQLELMSDFSVASYGAEPVIRRLLKEHGLIEVPEDGRNLSELNLAFDDHVHDSLSQGRKTPCQLLLDAFIKGMGRVCLAYYDLSDPRVFQEALEAGRLLGIEVETGIEFSVGPKGNRVHYMLVLPTLGSASESLAFLQRHQQHLAPFAEGLRVNADRRRGVLSAILEAFNRDHLPGLNARFREVSYLQLEPLSWDDVARAIHGGQASQIHLAQVLADKLTPLLHKRVLYLRNQYEHAQHGLRAARVSSWEVEKLRSDLEHALEEYRTCLPHQLFQRFVAASSLDYDSAFGGLEDLAGVLAGFAGTLVLIHPLSQGCRKAVRALLAHHQLIGGAEVFNMSDSQARDPSDLVRFGQLVDLLNGGDAVRAAALLESWGLSEEATSPELLAACRHYAARPLLPRCGSDYVGRNPWLPGMGFAFASRLSPRSRKLLLANQCKTIPHSLGEALTRWNPLHWPVPGEGALPAPQDHTVFAISPPQAAEVNLVGDETLEKLGSLRDGWRYLNPALKAFFKILIAFAPALYLVGFWYAALWLGITGFRNMMADLISAGGFHVRSWRLRVVDGENLSNSMFWTGFSVPILWAAKQGFDLGWAALFAATGGFLFTLTKFWCIAFANGLYISTHNRLRGFQPRVIRVNFFRTVLSWPLATAGSYALDLLAIPTIVQSKLWSDLVAGFIEGGNKFFMRLRLRQRDLLVSIRRLLEPDAHTRPLDLLDLLYIWGVRDMGRSALRKILKGKTQGLEHLPGRPDSREALEPALVWQRLSQLFGAPGAMEAITGAVLRSYSGRRAFVLSSLVSDLHQPFLDWLSQQQPRAPQPPSP